MVELVHKLPNYTLLAKQPIYDQDKNRVACELLFRNPMSLSADDVGTDLATHQVLANYCASVSSEVDDSEGLVFINVSSNVLLESEEFPVPPDKVVIDLENGFKASDENLTALKRWQEKGFKFALDPYDASQDHKKLLAYVDYAKVDVLDQDIDHIQSLMNERPSNYCCWIALRIEEPGVFEACKSIGFDLFQGYFLAKPTEVLGSSIRPGTAVTIRVIKELDRPGISMKEIAKLVAQDPKLSIQMLKIINSPLFNMPRPVTDIESALIYLGVDMLRQWAMILAFLSNGMVHLEVCRLVLLRAKTCEIRVRQQCGDEETASAGFLAGLVSGVDVLLNVLPEVFLKQVKLTDMISEAVVDKKGVIGDKLTEVSSLAYRVAQKRHLLDHSDESLLEAYEEASRWVDDVMKVLNA